MTKREALSNVVHSVANKIFVLSRTVLYGEIHPQSSEGFLINLTFTVPTIAKEIVFPYDLEKRTKIIGVNLTDPSIV